MENKTALKTAIQAAYVELRIKLLAFIRKRIGNVQNAEDILHDVFISAIKSMEQDQAPRNIGAWLYTIARNKVTDYFRSQHPTQELPDTLAQDETAQTALQQLSQCLIPLIHQLPEIYRDVLYEAEINLKTLPDIAREHELSVSAIKSRASRGRKMLREKIAQCCQLELSSAGVPVDFTLRRPEGCGGTDCTS